MGGGGIAGRVAAGLLCRVREYLSAWHPERSGGPGLDLNRERQPTRPMVQAAERVREARHQVYKALDQVFKEHCEVSARGRMKLGEKALDVNGQSSRTLQNPSEEGAGYSGHKGAGYQVQLAQACGQEEEGPGLIVACVLQSAAESDSGAVQSVIEQQQRMGTLPEEQLADTASGSQSNVEICASVNVTLIAPVPGRAATAKGPPLGTQVSAQTSRFPRLLGTVLSFPGFEGCFRHSLPCPIEHFHFLQDGCTGRRLFVKPSPAHDRRKRF